MSPRYRPDVGRELRAVHRNCRLYRRQLPDGRGTELLENLISMLVTEPNLHASPAVKLRSGLRELCLFMGLIGLVFLLRGTSFFLSMIDPDEGLYVLMSRSLLEGKLPYIEI